MEESIILNAINYVIDEIVYELKDQKMSANDISKCIQQENNDLNVS